MSPDAKQILQSILKRDITLTEREKAALRSVIDGKPMAPSSPQAIPVPQRNLGSRLLTRADVARHLNTSISTVERLEKVGHLSSVAITSDCPRFLPDEVQDFIQLRKAMRSRVRPCATASDAAA